jgi:hypothetical protein
MNNQSALTPKFSLLLISERCSNLNTGFDYFLRALEREAYKSIWGSWGQIQERQGGCHDGN